MSSAAGVETEVFDELVRASSRLSREFGFKDLVSVLVEQAIDITVSELACLYLYEDPEGDRGGLKLYYRRGRYDVPNTIRRDSQFVGFLEDAEESLVVLDRSQPFFSDLFLNASMNSAIALPLATPKARIGVLVLNALQENFYNRDRFYFLDSFTALASGMLHNRRLFDELKEQQGNDMPDSGEATEDSMSAGGAAQTEESAGE